jgi:hypothetical protein
MTRRDSRATGPTAVGRVANVTAAQRTLMTHQRGDAGPVVGRRRAAGADGDRHEGRLATPPSPDSNPIGMLALAKPFDLA